MPDEERIDFVTALQSDDRAVRWRAASDLAQLLFNSPAYPLDKAMIRCLTKELETDYSSYLAEKRAAIEEKLQRMVVSYESDLADYEKARAYAESQGDRKYLYLQGAEKFRPVEPDRRSAWRDGEIASIESPEAHFTNVMFVLTHFRAEELISVFPVLMNMRWGNIWRITLRASDDDRENGSINTANIHSSLIYLLGPGIIPELVRALGEGEPAATHATIALRKWGREAVPYLLSAEDDPDIVVRHRSRDILSDIRDAAKVEKPSAWKERYSRLHAKLLLLLDKSSGEPKTRERLRTLRSFSQYGSFRQAAAAEAKLNGYGSEPPDHSGPSTRMRRLGETLGVALTRSATGPGVKRIELTDEGKALIEWLDLHPWAFD